MSCELCLFYNPFFHEFCFLNKKNIFFGEMVLFHSYLGKKKEKFFSGFPSHFQIVVGQQHYEDGGKIHCHRKPIIIA